jgi:hypothetical protein
MYRFLLSILTGMIQCLALVRRNAQVIRAPVVAGMVFRSTRNNMSNRAMQTALHHEAGTNKKDNSGVAVPDVDSQSEAAGRFNIIAQQSFSDYLRKKYE